MNRPKKSLIPRLLLLTVLSLQPLWADELSDLKRQKEALEKEIAKTESQISRTDSITRVELKRYDLLKLRHDQDMERRLSELDSLEAKLKIAASALQAERSKQNSTEIQISNINAERKALQNNLARYTSDLEVLVQNSLPWEQSKRLDRIRALKRDLESGNASPEEGLSRLKAIYDEEIRFGDEIAQLNAPITRNNGELINARVLRMGNQWMIYMDENATSYGLLTRKTTGDKTEYIWKEDLDFSERQAIKLAIDVKASRKPPQLVSIPLSIDLKASSKGGEK
jgi:hypothetical protein